MNSYLKSGGWNKPAIASGLLIVAVAATSCMKESHAEPPQDWTASAFGVVQNFDSYQESQNWVDFKCASIGDEKSEAYCMANALITLAPDKQTAAGVAGAKGDAGCKGAGGVQ